MTSKLVAEPLDDQGGLGPPKIFEKKFFFFFENILKICKILNNFIIFALIHDNIHIYLRKSKNKLNFYLNKIQSINKYVNKLQ